jgi:hypothetical protein
MPELTVEIPKLRISSWQRAEKLAESYVRLNSAMERIEEAFREFATEHKREVGRQRQLGDVVLCFRKVSPAVVAKPTDTATAFLVAGYRHLVVRKWYILKAEVKEFLKKANAETVQEFADHGLSIRAGSEIFELKLAKESDEEEEE